MGHVVRGGLYVYVAVQIALARTIYTLANGWSTLASGLAPHLPFEPHLVPHKGQSKPSHTRLSQPALISEHRLYVLGDVRLELSGGCIQELIRMEEEARWLMACLPPRTTRLIQIVRDGKTCR